MKKYYCVGNLISQRGLNRVSGLPLTAARRVFRGVKVVKWYIGYALLSGKAAASLGRIRPIPRSLDGGRFRKLFVPSIPLLLCPLNSS